ncbi:MAG: hypothetical protein JWN95_1866 [Frankiales bacterium]|nr:hypothetical protein [Frankiales bacterium]
MFGKEIRLLSPLVPEKSYVYVFLLGPWVQERKF